jgi:GT2 family glycosyltransferase
MVNPKYSVVIPTYNHLDDFLKPCLESIIKYTDLQNTEIIVVANGCTDNTANYVNSLTSIYPSIKLIDIKEGLGYTKSTNIGIKAASGEYIVPLNNDTVLLEQRKNEWLLMLEQPFIDDPLMGVTGPLWQDDRITRYKFIIFFCAMIPKRLFDELGLLDEIFSPGSGEDIDFCIKAQLKGYKVQVVPYNTNLQKEGGKIVSGNFPIYHYAEGTFENIENYSTVTFKRNSLVNLKRYNKNIKLHLTVNSYMHMHGGYINVHSSNKGSDIALEWHKLDFEDNTISEIAIMDSFNQIPSTELQVYLKEWYRVLKSEGKLILLVPSPVIDVIKEKLLQTGFRVHGTQPYKDNIYIQAAKQ